MITARIIIIKCEAYIAMTASIILLGFGGSSFFKEYAINTMRYAFSVAFKLFVMQILMGVGMGFIDQLMIPAAAEYQDLFVVIACVVILLVLVNTIPEVAAGIINGSHIGAGVGMRAAVTGAMAAVGGAVGAAAGTVAAPTRLAGSVSDAAKIASLEGHSGAGAFGATVGNLWKGHSAARQSKNTMGSLNQRMSSHLKDRKATAKAASSVEDPWKEMMHAQDGGSKSKK